MAPGLPEQKFGTMWVAVDFRAMSWTIWSLNSAFLAMRLPTAESCWPDEASYASLAVFRSSIGKSPSIKFLGSEFECAENDIPVFGESQRDSEQLTVNSEQWKIRD